VELNNAAENLFGSEKEKLIGKFITDLEVLNSEGHELVREMLNTNVHGKSAGPEKIYLKDREGCEKPVEVKTFPISVQGRLLVLLTVKEILCPVGHEMVVLQQNIPESIYSN